MPGSDRHATAPAVAQPVLPYQPPPERRKGAALARAAMCLSLLFVPVAALAMAMNLGSAVALSLLLPISGGLLGLAVAVDTAADPRTRRVARRAFGWAAGQGLVLALVALLVPGGSPPREQANRIKCASNLRQIGQALQNYSHEHRGMYPPSFDELLLTGDLVPACFICPSSNHTQAATGATTRATVSNFQQPGCCSYVYAAGGADARTLTARHVVAYEDPQNHGGSGANFLYGDGYVEWRQRDDAAATIAKLNAGLNPPWQPATRPGG